VRVKIRQADLDSDADFIVEMVRRYLNPNSDRVRFDWLYRQGPFGDGKAWIAMDAANGDLVGVAAAFPRRICCTGIPRSGWVLGDFCITDPYRSLGPAVMLQQACMAGITTGDGGTLWYDFPSAAMMAVYRRLGINPCDQVVRMAKPLRTDRKIGETVKAPLIARALCDVGNRLLQLKDLGLGGSGDYTLTLHEGRCDEEFSELASRVSACHATCILRSGEYLNWRYLAHPHRRHEIVIARDGGRLIAYAVFTQSGHDAILVDLFGLVGAPVLRSLVRKVTAILRARGVMTLSAPFVASHPSIRLLEGLGFHARESSPVVASLPSTQGSPRSPHWFLTEGDRDS
jgi:hypothetical protein